MSRKVLQRVRVVTSCSVLGDRGCVQVQEKGYCVYFEIVNSSI